MRSIVYSGASQFISRYGQVSTGDVLSLSEAEAEEALLDSRFFELPVLTQDVLTRTTGLTLDATHNGKLLRFNHTGAIEVLLPVTAPAAGWKVELEHGPTSDESTITVDPGDISIRGVTDVKKVLSIAVTNAGTGFTAVPTIGFTGGAGSGATATARMKLLTAAIASGGGGTGYTQDDVLTVAGAGTAATITVATVDGSGVITAITVTTGGSYATLPDVTANAVTGGTGTGAAIDLSTFGVDTIVVGASGEGYTSTPTVTFTGGSGTGAAATATMEDIGADYALTFAIHKKGIYFDGEMFVLY